MRTPLKILVAEDQMVDLFSLRRAFTEAGVDPPIHFARTGREVRDYLEGNPPFENPVRYPLPDLLVLDLHLPRPSGFEILAWLRQHPTLGHLPVVLLSASDTSQEVSGALNQGANFHVPRPQNPVELVELVERLQNYWFRINPSIDADPAQHVPVAS